MGASPNEKIVRRVVEVVNRCNSVEEAIATGVEELWDPEIEYVNPEDAVERGTRKGVAGMRTVLENLLAGAGAGATSELEELQERGTACSSSPASTRGARQAQSRCWGHRWA